MPENPRSSGTALETELGQDGRGPERQGGPRGYTQGRRGVPVCGALSPPTAGPPCTLVSAPLLHF